MSRCITKCVLCSCNSALHAKAKAEHVSTDYLHKRFLLKKNPSAESFYTKPPLDGFVKLLQNEPHCFSITQQLALLQHCCCCEPLSSSGERDLHFHQVPNGVSSMR